MGMPGKHYQTELGGVIRYKDSQYKDKTVLRPSHLYNKNPYTWKMVFGTWTHPMMESGMKDNMTPREKQNPGQKVKVTGYNVLNTVLPTIPLKLWREPTAANILPAITTRGHMGHY